MLVLPLSRSGLFATALAIALCGCGKRDDPAPASVVYTHPPVEDGYRKSTRLLDPDDVID